jgi:hypothetical protein
MTADSKDLKLAKGRVAPQFYDETKQDYDYQKGSDGAIHMKVVNFPGKQTVLGSIVEFYHEGEANFSQTFQTTMNAVSIANDGLENLTFTINGTTRTVYPGETYTGILKPFTQITINASDKYRMEVLT